MDCCFFIVYLKLILKSVVGKMVSYSLFILAMLFFFKF